MRPIERGSCPKDDNGNEKNFTDYVYARADLINRLGEYCSYCEMHLDASLAVEHVQPKKPPKAIAVDQIRALNWDNFLLSCTNCNSTKGNTDVDLQKYLWPDRDNTFRAFKYSEGGLISPALEGDLRIKAENMIRLTGLNRTPSNDSRASDRRWENRRETWDIAQRSKGNLKKCDNPIMRDQIILTATGHGYWSIWMTVFCDDNDMTCRLINAFKGTSKICFDMNSGNVPIYRQNGQC